MRKPVPKIAIEVGGEPVEIPQALLENFPDVVSYMGYIASVRDVQLSTLLQYARYVVRVRRKGSLHKVHRLKDPTELASVKLYWEWRQEQYTDRLHKVQQVVPDVDATVTRQDLVAPSVPGAAWMLRGVVLSPDQLNAVATAFYAAWGTDRRIEELKPDDLLFGEVPLNVADVKIVSWARKNSDVALGVHVSELEGFQAQLKKEVPDFVVLDKRLTQANPEAFNQVVDAIRDAWVSPGG